MENLNAWIPRAVLLAIAATVGIALGGISLDGLDPRTDNEKLRDRVKGRKRRG